MHGIVFKSMKDFVVQNHGQETWDDICERAGLGHQIYLTIDTYEDGELLRIAGATATQTGVSIPDFLEAFGRHAAGQFLETYRNAIREEWSALDLVENAETQVHATLRTYNPAIDPPKLVCRRDSDSQVTIRYRSDRRLCFVAKGIVQGIGDHYGERLDVSETRCMHTGGDHCELVVRR